MATPELRKELIVNLIYLVKLVPKIDPIVKDLSTQLDSDKLTPEQKEDVSISLMIIVFLMKKKINDAVKELAVKTMTRITNIGLPEEIQVYCQTILDFMEVNIGLNEEQKAECQLRIKLLSKMSLDKMTTQQVDMIKDLKQEQ